MPKIETLNRRIAKLDKLVSEEPWGVRRQRLIYARTLAYNLRNRIPVVSA